METEMEIAVPHGGALIALHDSEFHAEVAVAPTRNPNWFSVNGFIKFNPICECVRTPARVRRLLGCWGAPSDVY